MSSHSNITLPTSPPPLPPCPRHPVPLTLPRTSPGNIWGSSPFPRSHPHLAPRLPLSAHPFPSSPACPSLRNLAWPPHPRRVKASSLPRLFPPPFPTPQEPQIFAAPSQRLCEGCCFRQDCAHLLQVIPQCTGGTKAMFVRGKIPPSVTHSQPQTGSKVLSPSSTCLDTKRLHPGGPRKPGVPPSWSGTHPASPQPQEREDRGQQGITTCPQGGHLWPSRARRAGTASRGRGHFAATHPTQPSAVPFPGRRCACPGHPKYAEKGW